MLFVLSIAPFWNWNSEFWVVISQTRHNSQSHHFGIETKIIALYPWTSKCSQSHHFGIETFTGQVGNYRLAASQSHHFGIETEYDSLSSRSLEFSQSHHFGIETFLFRNNLFQSWFSQSHHFGIETFGQEELINCRDSLNRTILELKQYINRASNIGFRLSIAPFWNWNCLRLRWTGDWQNLSIAPFWNWNESNAVQIPAHGSLSIAPFWNWNKHYYPHRTEGTHLSIAPFWNWNLLPAAPIFSVLFFSQSHHFGIETPYIPGKFRLAVFSQSHHFGIETMLRPPSLLTLVGSQSHHFGIETNITLFTKIFNISLNRTILELKHVDRVREDIKNLPLNRTILELKQRLRKLLDDYSLLSIAPFWNWNEAKDLVGNGKGRLSIAPFWNWNSWAVSRGLSFWSLNRTILELKPHRQPAISPWCIIALNRTILELKREIPHKPREPLASQSHHFGIETQLINIQGFSSRILSIAPFWNWNLSAVLFLRQLFCSQSHHFGIETKFHGLITD